MDKKKKKLLKEKIVNIIKIVISKWWIMLIIVVVVGAGLIKISSKVDKGKTKILSASTLKEVIDISELSTAQYTYNGIAEKYKNDKSTKVECYIRYSAKVKVGIDMKQVDFKIDEENKTITPILPEIQINSNTVDETKLSFIPANANIEIKDALVVCEADAEKESRESTKLIESARENLKSIIEALLDPILTDSDYSIQWEE